MDTSITRELRADPEVVFALAAAVEDWPRLLPHYRWVRVLAEQPGGRLVEMAARRDLLGRLGIPLWWRSLQSPDPSSRTIRFEHVAGITRGMQVEWRLLPRADGRLEVRIRHVFRPHWPVPDWLVERVVGQFFVNAVAARTLWHISQLAEQTPKRA
jgi:ribosome-associated toxin RatA of RatAB toxin-antitoxin module